MSQDKHYQSYLAFVSKLSDLIASHTLEDLQLFLSKARNGFPDIVPVIESCIYTLDKNVCNANKKISRKAKILAKIRPEVQKDLVTIRQEIHLFDLLRSKELFPNNRDLAEFATRVLPGMVKRRYDKMSKAGIAGIIIGYLETLNAGKRKRLEKSMREAIISKSVGSKEERQSFFSEWEKIIKGIDL